MEVVSGGSDRNREEYGMKGLVDFVKATIIGRLLFLVPPGGHRCRKAVTRSAPEAA
jgi:hypothetical protein